MTLDSIWKGAYYLCRSYLTRVLEVIDLTMENTQYSGDFNRGVYISTYGCQMNVNDSERMYALLEMANYVPVLTPEEASLIIINSCSVREKPVHKVHSEVGRYRKLKEQNPGLKIGVGGCVGQQEKDKLLKDVQLLDFVFGPDNIDELPSLVERVKNTNLRFSHAKFQHQKPYQVETLVRNPGVATFVNITKGCDNFCTFCVVPFTRGRLRSRPMKEIVNDVKVLIKRGVKEVTLLGQNVNSYESECGTNFAQLMRILAEDTDITRIRYTTSHPKDFTQELVDVSAKYRSKICDYVHLPAQSGSTKVLREMNRVYTKEEYFSKVQMIQEGIPGVSLSTDLIVGFPGESEDDFWETMDLIERVPYESIYAFSYSPRPFTKAARFENQVPDDVKSERLTRLLKRHREIAFEFAKKYEGATLEILVEETDKQTEGLLMGRSTQNKVVHFKGDNSLIGQLVSVKVQTAYPQTFWGELQ